jgi:hypothetical protein
LQQQLLIFKNGTAFTRRLYTCLFPDRKDTTGNLDEVQIENIAKLQKRVQSL